MEKNHGKHSGTWKPCAFGWFGWKDVGFFSRCSLEASWRRVVSRWILLDDGGLQELSTQPVISFVGSLMFPRCSGAASAENWGLAHEQDRPLCLCMSWSAETLAPCGDGPGQLVKLYCRYCRYINIILMYTHIYIYIHLYIYIYMLYIMFGPKGFVYGFGIGSLIVRWSRWLAQDLPRGHLHQAWSWAAACPGRPGPWWSVAVQGFICTESWNLHSESAKSSKCWTKVELFQCIELIGPQFYFGFWEGCSKRWLVTLGKRRSGLLSLSMCMFCMKQLLVRCQMSKTRTVARMSSKTASEKAVPDEMASR